MFVTVRLLNLLPASATHNAIRATANIPSNPMVASGAIRVPLDLLTNRIIQRVFFFNLLSSTQQKATNRQAAEPAINLNWMEVE